jgi:predicted DNA-binding transcriptional regulator AlpA
MPPDPIRLHQAGAQPRPSQEVLAPDLDGQRLIDRAEFQALLGIGQSTFERLKAAGRLPPHLELSKTLHRWRLATVLEWLRDGCPKLNR